MERIILVGGGGHCRVVMDSIARGGVYAIHGIIDIPANVGNSVDGVMIIGSDLDLEKIRRQGVTNFIIAVGSVSETAVRSRLFKTMLEADFVPVNVIDPTATISKGAGLGNGNFIGARAIVNTGTSIENNVIVNTGAIIEHDCQICDNVHIAPGVVLSGGVRIGRGTHIGTGAVIVQGINIGSDSLIGAGSVVVRDFVDGSFAYGNPCRERRKK